MAIELTTFKLNSSIPSISSQSLEKMIWRASSWLYDQYQSKNAEKLNPVLSDATLIDSGSSDYQYTHPHEYLINNHCPLDPDWIDRLSNSDLPQNVAVISDFCHQRLSDPDRLKNACNWQKKTTIVIPVGCRDNGLGHLVTFIVHLKSHTIEYFDPKGCALEERKFALTIFLKIHEHLSSLYPETITSWLRLSNIKKIQEDNYNCSVYCYDFIVRRIQREFFETIIMTRPLTRLDADTRVRADMLKNLYPESIQKAANLDSDDFYIVALSSASDSHSSSSVCLLNTEEFK